MNSDRKKLAEEIISVADYIAAMLRPLSNTDVPIKNSLWSIGTAAAHLVISQRLSKRILQGHINPYRNARPETVAAANARLLAEFKERRGERLSTMLIMDSEAFLKEVGLHEDTDTVKTHFGIMDMPLSLSYNLCHLLIHGNQIAKALNKSVQIQPSQIAMVLPFLKQAMFATYDKEAAKEFRGIFVIHLRNLSSYAVICNEDQIMITENIPHGVDCHISADPVAFFLISTGSMNQWEALMKGKCMVWGRKPWLALRLTTLFKSP